MKLQLAAALLGAAAFTQPALADDYPSQPVHLIVPYSPGGVLDTTARNVGQELQEILGQPVVINNRPGGNAAIGTSVAAGAEPDGYTLLIATSAEAAVAPALRDDLPYDMDRDFRPITLVNDTPIVILASGESGFQTIGDVVAASADRTVSYGTPSVGSSHHLLGEALAFEAGMELLHIAYQGAAPAAAAVASGEVDLGIASISAALPHIESVRAVVLAVASKERVEVLSDTPTLMEEGLDLTASVWIGLFAPADTPDAVVDTISDAMRTVLEMPAIAERFATSGAVPMWSEAEDLTAHRRAETERSREIIEVANIQIE